jgi:uncharacterized membrane protein
MSWFDSDYDKRKKKEEEKKETMSQKFFSACLLILAGIVAVWLALELLAQIWMWIVLVGLIVLGCWIAYRVIRARQDRW